MGEIEKKAEEVLESAYKTASKISVKAAQEQFEVLGIGLAFNLRMARAYLHMSEHNQHKLRVTNSIEAFVAAVRTNEQKDLVLGKLVESVTQFGDSGILGEHGDSSNLPSVMFDSITKNVSKSE